MIFAKQTVFKILHYRTLMLIFNFDALEKSLVINHNSDSSSHHYQMNLNLN